MLEIRTSLRPERPGTTPEGNERQEKSKDKRKGKRKDKPDQKRDESKGKENEKQRQERPTSTNKPRKKKQSTTKPREERRGTRKERWSQKQSHLQYQIDLARGVGKGHEDQGATVDSWGGEVLTVRTSLRPEKPGTK